MSQVTFMTDVQEHAIDLKQKNSDGCADVFATLAIMAIVVGTVVFWLHSMPK